MSDQALDVPLAAFAEAPRAKGKAGHGWPGKAGGPEGQEQEGSAEATEEVKHGRPGISAGHLIFLARQA